ncbi:MAG TPA: electron transfer flavoprotein subunit beta/FixA family protein [Candidatus Mediterraneibacter merdipullorum]|nr:electron transfer flavoprotein subunit beta/FixA family protein [Candidatus Mediterraneibacter merdipullorum]
MKIVCLLKFTPDVDAFEYDYENNVLIRENIKQIINLDDACALGYALNLKKKHPEIEIEVVTMGPLSVKGLMEDVLRRRVDRGTILSDPVFAGSDTLATSLILGEYLKRTEYDVILTGTQTLDGDTAHVPSQLAGYLGIGQMSAIMKIDEASFLEGAPLVEVDTENHTDTYKIAFPAILSVRRESRYRLPFVRYADLEMDVSDRLHIIDNSVLQVDENIIGTHGSATKVVKTYMQTYERKDRVVVQNDDEGIETVYNFLKENGYLK